MKKVLKKLAIKLYFGNSLFRKGIKFGKDSYVFKNPQIIGGGYFHLGNHVSIGKEARLCCWPWVSGETFNPNVTIEDNVFIGRNATISSCNKILIKKNTTIAGYVFISDNNHGMNPSLEESYECQKMIVKETIIGENVFIGEKSLILPGVHLGNNVIVAAGSVVTKSFEDNVLIGGNPAKVIKKFDFDKKEWVRV